MQTSMVADCGKELRDRWAAELEASFGIVRNRFITGEISEDKYKELLLDINRRARILIQGFKKWCWNRLGLSH